MTRYVDGFVLPIATDKVHEYRKVAEKAAALWKEHGALEYIECQADDLHARDMVDFRTLANASEDETVIFAWIVYPSRQARDKINAAVMKDPRMAEMCTGQTFDYKRMAYGGFQQIVSA